MKVRLKALAMVCFFASALAAHAQAQTPVLVKGGIDVSNMMVAAGDTLFFSAWGSGTGIELWKSDGTTDGTVLVKDIRTGPLQTYFQQFAALGDMLIFTADNTTYGYELWASDGTAGGTCIIADLNSGTNNGISTMGGGLTAYNGRVYAKASDGTSGYEPWSTDGSDVSQLKDINVGSGWGFSNWPLFTASNGILFMVADDGVTDEELWKTDGTEGNTVQVKDINTADVGAGYGPSHLIDLGGILYFTADDSSTPWSTSNRELWRSDGIDNGTYMVKDINPNGPGIDGTQWSPEFTVVNNKLFFVADNGTTGQELWISDGTEEGTQMVKDIYPGAFGSEPHGLYAGGTKLFFGADDGSGYGDELWVSDGTPDGTSMVRDIRTGSSGGYLGALGAIYDNGIFYFQANDGTTGTELWRSDGTEGGTYRVADLYSGTGSSEPENFINLNGTVYFSITGSNAGLWKIDTSADTTTTTSVLSSTTTTASGDTTTTTAPSSDSTTTTSIGGGASTTTTTTGGGRSCPAKQVLGADNPKLENLRAFRDSKLAGSAVGRRVIQIYYSNADSINAVLEHSPALRAAVRRVLEAIAPKVGRKQE